MRPASDPAPVAVSRRAILATAVAVGPVALLAGCRDEKPARPDPDAAALAAARDTELRLIGAYDALAATSPALARLRDTHLAHLNALGGEPPSASPSSGVPSDPASLVRSSAATLQAAAVQAHAGRVAAVLASIAAAHLAETGRAP